MNKAIRISISEDTATDYLENTYEAVKMLIQLFMALDGYSPYSHKAIIAYATAKKTTAKANNLPLIN